ncbi:CIC11C00000002957 [Sungouiella intermedia]|uniref:CIC11C00000002957 n=1 Tax=Sungouiella intermedia TaxID=45354 RepID=A0A1L0D5N2_9ASCO|nr:CIC11C00000002957 [[Candida] intermedia]
MSEANESEQPTPLARHNSIIEVLSDEEPEMSTSETPVNRRRRLSVIEVLTDESDDDVQFVSETPAGSDSNEVEITGQNHINPIQTDLEYPGAPPRPRAPLPPLRNRRRVRRRHNPPGDGNQLFVDFEDLGETPIPFLLANGRNEFLRQRQHAILRMIHMYGQQDVVSNTIMERLARDDEAALDRKIANENIHNRRVLQQKEGVAAGEAEGYTNNITANENLMCELCGVELGEGIPSDFKPDPRYDENLSEYAGRFRVNAPWFCIRQCFDADIELSKRVFAAKCGHVFCGRCIKNIGNRPPGRQSKKQSEALSIINPQISAPRKCPAKDCGIMFTKGKKTFSELFI